LTPEAAHVRGSDPAQIQLSGTGRLLEHKKAKDPGENLGG
jgi:hypothetical protein